MRRAYGEKRRLKPVSSTGRARCPGTASKNRAIVVQLGAVERQRLLDQHVLAGAQRRERHRRVQVVPRRDDHRVDVGVVQHLS